MSTWGTGSFENDTASDWIWAIKPAVIAEPFAYPMSAISQLLRSDLYLAAQECHQAIAAAECIARANTPNDAPADQPTDQPAELSVWLTSLNGRRPEPTMTRHAIEAVTTIRNNEQSELREHWAKQDQLDQWLAAIDDLLDRLKRPTD